MIEIRDAVVADAGAIAEINAACWRTAYRGIIDNDRLKGIPVKAWAREIAANLEELAPGSFDLVAEVDGVVAGSCFVSAPARDGDLGDEVAELVAIYVHPDRWAQGIGRALAAEAVNRSTALGFKEMSLWTLVMNDRALAFYEALGWKPDGREQVHPVARAPALRMSRPLG